MKSYNMKVKDTMSSAASILCLSFCETDILKVCYCMSNKYPSHLGISVPHHSLSEDNKSTGPILFK